MMGILKHVNIFKWVIICDKNCVIYLKIENSYY